MSGSIYFELGPLAAARLRRIMDTQGETDPARMIARALALFEAVEGYMTPDARLRVLRPGGSSLGDSPEDVVEFQLTRRQAGEAQSFSQ